MTNKSKQTDWYKDAIIYQLHVLSFYDSNGDGIGDFRGLVHKLDYLVELGVNTLWLLPFYPSPLRDGGYDIADFTAINPSYGTINEFKKFIKEAHKRGLRIITELVLNHTSSSHKWFQRARNAKPGSNYRDFYVWNDTPDKYSDARIIFQDFESSNWSWDPVAKSYYWHRFYSHQPDLNYENENLHKAMFKILNFWFDAGVDGLRLDAVPYLFEKEGTNCENLPETHAFLKKLRAYIDENYTDKMLLAEANQWPEDSSAYFGDGDECHMAFNFPLMPRLYMSLQMEDRFPVIDIMEQMPEIPDACQWAVFLRNHDELTLEMVTDEERDFMYKSFALDPRQRINLGIRRRLSPLLGNDKRKIELMNTLLFSLPGTPIVYYGDEIGMGDNPYLGDRDGVRTPMQWAPNKNAGFSEADPQRLFLPVNINYDYHYESVNVENQERSQASLLWWMRRVIAKRKQYKAFSRGSIKFLNTNNSKVLAFIRKYKEERIFVLINLSRYSQLVKIDLSEYIGYIPVEVFSQNEFGVIGEEEYPFPLSFKDYFWFELKKPDKESLSEQEGLNKNIELNSSVWNKLDVDIGTEFTGLLLSYIRKSRWFRGKSRKVKSLRLLDTIKILADEFNTYILIVSINYIEIKPEIYVLPVSIATGEDAAAIRHDTPYSVISNARFEGIDGLLYDGTYDRNLQAKLLDIIYTSGRIKGRKGSIYGKPGKILNKLVKKNELPLNSHVISADQSNTSILYSDKLFFKIYRNPDEGKNPEVEILKVLTENTQFTQLPPFAGSLEYLYPGKENISLAILVGFAENKGNAWDLTETFINQYFERILTSDQEIPQPNYGQIPAMLDDYKQEGAESLDNLIDGFFLEMVDLLGERTADMHLALASEKTNPDFVPEAFSLLYQKSMYQTFRTLIKRTYSDIRSQRKKIPEENEALLNVILGNESNLLNHIKIALESGKISSMKTRIHGDYHLGQVLFTGKDFIIIDFEGEPVRSLSARKLKYCPFRDIAGMLRSFHYAIYMGLLKEEDMYPGSSTHLNPWLEHWYQRVSFRFLRSYLKKAEGAAFIPQKSEDVENLINLFLVEKAVYEIDYEMNNRPDWLKIPLNGLARIVGNIVPEKG